MEPMEKKEPMDAIEQADPTEPIDRMDPLEPIERNESSDHNDHREVAPELFVIDPSCRERFAGGSVSTGRGRGVYDGGPGSSQDQWGTSRIG
jgi:hypothetical protein